MSSCLLTIVPARVEKILFQDAMEGTGNSPRKDAAKNLVEHPKYGRAYYFLSAKAEYPTTASWIGDESWYQYRVEYEFPGGGAWKKRSIPALIT